MFSGDIRKSGQNFMMFRMVPRNVKDKQLRYTYMHTQSISSASPLWFLSARHLPFLQKTLPLSWFLLLCTKDLSLTDTFCSLLPQSPSWFTSQYWLHTLITSLYRPKISSMSCEYEHNSHAFLKHTKKKTTNNLHFQQPRLGVQILQTCPRMNPSPGDRGEFLSSALCPHCTRIQPKSIVHSPSSLPHPSSWCNAPAACCWRNCL